MAAQVAHLLTHLVLALFVVRTADARPHTRKHFEPTDLEFEQPGTSELDLEIGLVRGPDAWRLVAPDFELDLGLTRWLEIGIDGAYAIEGDPDRPLSFRHAAPDPLWPAFKLGLLDIDDNEAARSYAIGAQLGPKLPTISTMHGVGIEGLLLVGARAGHTELGLNVGGFVDPAANGGPRPTGFESSIACERDLDAAGRYSLGGQLVFVVFKSPDPTVLQAAFGPSYAATSWLDLSLAGTLGLLPGGDRYGLLLGVAPHLPLWNAGTH